MERLNWVVVILAISTTLLMAREKATQPSFVILWFLLNFVFVGLFVFYRCYRLQLPPCSPKDQHLERWNLHACQVKNSLYELYRPMGNHKMQVVFFHGLPLGDFSIAHLSTWESEDGSCLWPKTWLGEEFPNAHILVAFYTEALRECLEDLDMHIISENLMSDLLSARVGQRHSCPVVLVGHSFGGLVIKKLCVVANNMSNSHGNAMQAKKFLDNLKGIFYYSTPHHGSHDISKATNILDSPLFKYFTTLNPERERLNQDFDRLCWKWQTRGLGEGQRVDVGLFRDVTIVPEASAREGDIFNVDEKADHFSITKPQNKISRRFTALTDLLHNIATHLKDDAYPQNWQRLPEQMKGLDFRLDQVKAKLKDHRTLGFVGMGGLGKTTLAKATFNEFASTFEYACFVCDVKSIKGSKRELKEELWKDMHCDGKKVETMVEWFTLRGKKLLLILDDITMDRDVEVLLDIASDVSSESRFIVTSRNHHLLKGFDNVYDVPLLDDSNSKELFMSHAFPNSVSPPLKLADYIDDIVEKCSGLPLTLEVLGKYLEKIDNKKHWKDTLGALDKAEQVIDLEESLWMKLRLSYDGLGEKEQQMFLDATTFFGNPYAYWTLKDALVAWSQTYETNAWPLWQSLVSRSLVYKVKEDQHIRIHDQLKSLGRKIASESSSQCRVWEQKEARKVLQTSKHIDNKEYHAFQLLRKGWQDEVIDIGGSTLHQLKNVHFLELDECAIGGTMEVESCPRKLVLLKCVGLKFFNPTLQSSLVILNIDLSVELLPSSIEELVALRVLTLSSRNSFMSFKQTLPESFGNLSALEHLKFQHYNLEALPKSFGNLSALEHLEFDYCPKLEALPESFGNLRALEHLVFESCHGLKALPESFGNLSKLEYLVFKSCLKSCLDLKALPKSFGNLSALEHLVFESCHDLKALPESFGNLPALEHLKFMSCLNLEALPESFGSLSALEHLEFIQCSRLNALPESFGHLAKLQYLEITEAFDRCGTGKLPDSLAELKALRHLVVDCVFAESIPDYIKSMQLLHTLELGRLPLVNELPGWLGEMGTAPLALSRKTFQMQDGHFALTSERRISKTSELKCFIRLLHQSAMKKMRASDFEGAIADLCKDDLGVRDIKGKGKLALHGFLLQERGILKRFSGDLQGALEDLTAALKALPEDKILGLQYAHDCWKHRGYVNFLLGDLQGAQKDGVMALRLLSKYNCESVISPCLGEQSVTYMHFSLTNTSTIKEEMKLMKASHSCMMEKVRTGEFAVALAIWDDFNASVSIYHGQAFFLQEKGIIKRLSGDLQGALEDLTAAVKAFSEEDDIHEYTYDCWKHRGYVNFLLGDLQGAQSAGVMALKLLCKHNCEYKHNCRCKHICRTVISPCLGEELVTYPHIRLTNMSGIREELELKKISHSCVMEKVRARKFKEALAIWDEFNARVSGYHNQAFFLQERGILKRFCRDLHGALEDLTAALEIWEDDYDCFKHRGYVKSLMGDLDGARMDAASCVASKRAKFYDRYLGGLPVSFLEFTL